MNKKAFSSDGYIINQDYTAELPYGVYASSYNGCGWIAMFNLLKALGMEPDYGQVYREMCAILPYEGRMGTPVETMEQYLREKGIPYDYAEGKERVGEIAEAYAAGIFRYAEQGDPHYVAFRNEGGGRFRFFNADTSKEMHICSMERFFREHVVRRSLRALLTKELGGKKA